MPTLPNFNPIFAGEVVCSECGETMKKTLKKNPRGQVEAVVYTCINPERGCSYKIENDVRLTQACQIIREKKKEE